MRMKFNVPMHAALCELAFNLCLLCPDDAEKGAALVDGVELLAEDGVYRSVELEVMCDYTEGHPGSWYAPNGDPGDPPEPDELQLHSVSCAEPLCFKWEGFTLQLAAGTDLLPMLSRAGLDHLTDNLYPLAAAALADERNEALIDAAESRAERYLEEPAIA